MSTLSSLPWLKPGTNPALRGYPQHALKRGGLRRVLFGHTWPAASARQGRRGKQAGQSLVEFALVVGVLLAIILCGIDAIQILVTQYTVNQAVRASAHQAALVGGPDGSDGNVATATNSPQNTIARTAQLVLDSGMTTSADKATITVTCTNPQTGAVRNPCRRYDAVEVRIQYLDEVWAPFLMFDQVRADHRTTRAAEKDQQ
jgi:TadE-like protein